MSIEDLGDFDLLDWIRAEMKEQYLKEVEHVFMYGGPTDVVRTLTPLDMQERAEWRSYQDFYCAHYYQGRCKGRGHTINGIVHPELKIHLCHKHWKRHHRMEYKRVQTPPSSS